MSLNTFKLCKLIIKRDGMLKIIIVVSSLFSGYVFANENTATLVYKKGDVVFLTQPSEKVHTGSGQVLFNNLYYKIKPAKLGRKIKLGEAVKVGPDGSAKLTFDNGDQFIVGAGTTYSLTDSRIQSGDADKSAEESDKRVKGPVLNIFYGKMRAIISQKGDRNQLRVQTRGAIAGVRGTDFFISAAPEEIQLTVLRGKVAIKKKEQSKEAIIEKGMVAKVDVKSKAKSLKPSKSDSVELVVVEATKDEILLLQESTKLSANEMIKEKDLDERTKKEILALENKAKDAIIEDIKIFSPATAAKLTLQKDLTLEKLNSEVVFEIYKAAPKIEKNKKLKREDLQYSDDEIYKKHF